MVSMDTVTHSNPSSCTKKQTYSAKERLYLQSMINVLKLPKVDLDRPTKKGLRVLKRIEKAKVKRREWLAKYGHKAK